MLTRQHKDILREFVTFVAALVGAHLDVMIYCYNQAAAKGKQYCSETLHKAGCVNDFDPLDNNARVLY